jgi:hypothetical protein
MQKSRLFTPQNLGDALFLVAVLLCGQPDWEVDIAPGIRAALAGDNPYAQNRMFFLPPWAIPPLAPFAVLPHPVDNLALTAAALVVYHRLLRPTWLLLWPPLLLSLGLGQIEWLICAALLLPAWAGALLASIKPQVGAGLLLYYALRGRWRSLIPLALVFGLSLAVYGEWWLTWNRLPSGLRWFPYSLPLGMVFLFYALWGKEKRWALASSPFLSVYCWHYHWAAVILIASSSQKNNRRVSIMQAD